MRIRPYHPADGAKLHEIYLAQGFQFPFPDLREPQFMVKQVLVDRGALEMAVVCRRTSEAYLFMAPGRGTPEEMLEKFRQLSTAGEAELRKLGFTDVHSWIPKSHRRFGRRLAEQFGWVRDDDYTPFCKYL